MATTSNGSSPGRSPSRDYVQSDNQQSNGRANLESHRRANGEGESPYASSYSNMRGYVSAVDLRENVAGANSAGQLSLGGGPHPASSRFVAPRAKASKSFQPAADADAEPFVPDRADLRRRGADGPHDCAAPVLSTPKSPDPLAPNGSHITQRAGGPMRPSRSILSNESPHTATASKETSKPPRSMPLNAPPHAATSPPTSNNTAKPSRQRVNNGHTPYEPPRREKAGSGPPQAEKVSPRGTDLNISKSQAVDPPSLAQPPAIQDVHLPSPPKVPSTSGRPLAPPASPGVTKTYSRWTQEAALGEPQVPRGIPVPAEEPVFPDESRETVSSKTKGGHEPLNGQPAPINASSPAADHVLPSVPTAEHRPPTPPKAAVARFNSPSLLQVDRSGSEYNHGTSESRHGSSESRAKSESLDPAVILGGTAITGPSLTPPPPALLRPLNDIVRGNASTSSLAVSSSDDGIGLPPKSTGMERRQSSRPAETMSGSASRRPQIESPQSTGMSNQGREPSLSSQLGSERSGSADFSPRPTGIDRRQSNRHAETMSRSASRRPQMKGPQSTGISNQRREPTLSSQPQAERSDSMDDVLPPPAYASKVTPPTPVAEEGPSASTGQERERISPPTSPAAPIRTHQPEHHDPMQLPSDLTQTPSLSRSHSAQTHRSSKSAPASVAPSTADPRGRAKEAIPTAQAAVPKQDEPQKQNVINIFCCCSGQPNNGLPKEPTN